MMKSVILALALLAGAEAFSPAQLGAKLRTRARSSAFNTAMNAEQDFLEADPYFDQKNIPLNTYKNKSPFTSKVVSCTRIVGPQATGET